MDFSSVLTELLQTASATYLFVFAPFLFIVGFSLTIYTLFFTNYWIVTVAYCLWAWIIDKDTPERGGRRNEFFCSFRLYKFAKDYFPINLRLPEGLVLDAKRNYLFCAFPHALLPVGAFLSTVTNAANFNGTFPNHIVHGLILPLNFKFPIVRDVMMLMGACSASAKSVSYLLNSPEGGRIAVLSVGGIDEMYYSRPGPYHVVVKKRKGFVKLALRSGSPLVPMFTFGENVLYDVLGNSEESLMGRFRIWCKEKANFPIVIFAGRGYLPIPRRREVNVVVGAPIEVDKIENPTQEDIDSLHSKFVEELQNLFNDHKHKYIQNPEHASLIIC